MPDIKIIYRVCIDYKEFNFSEYSEAIIFAQAGFLTQAEDYDIRIKLIQGGKEDASHI